jgi:hypothetical protein
MGMAGMATEITEKTTSPNQTTVTLPEKRLLAKVLLVLQLATPRELPAAVARLAPIIHRLRLEQQQTLRLHLPLDTLLARQAVVVLPLERAVEQAVLAHQRVQLQALQLGPLQQVLPLPLQLVPQVAMALNLLQEGLTPVAAHKVPADRILPLIPVPLLLAE